MKFLNKTILGLVAAVGFLGLTTTHAEARHYYGHHYYGHHYYGGSYYGGPRVVYHSYYRPYGYYDPYYYDSPYAYGPGYGGVTFAFGGGGYRHHYYGHRRW